MSIASKEEKAWMRKVERLLMNPPTERLGLSTMGDCSLFVHDNTKDAEINSLMDATNRDHGACVDEAGAGMGIINSAMNIHSVAG